MTNTGLILEGGGMRGIFTAGVLDWFLEKDINFDQCLAVSAGACHACSYLTKQYGRALTVSSKYVGDKNYCSLHSLVTTGDLFGAKMLYETIPLHLYPINNEAFLNNATTLQAVVTNCMTGEAEYLHVKDLIKDVDYVRASSSMPIVSNMVQIGKSFYLDGGIADSIPIKQSISQGNLKNVVVLTQHRSYRKKRTSLSGYLKIKYQKYPQLLEKMLDRHCIYNDTLDFLAKQERKGNVFIISPQMPPDIGRVEKNKGKIQALYLQGYIEAKRVYNDLLSYLQN